MKIISLTVTVGFLIYFLIRGVYDPFSLTTTSEIKSDYSYYIGKTLKIQQVAILNTQVIKKEGQNFLIKLTIYNGKSLFGRLDTTDYLKYKDRAIDVFAWISNESGLWDYVDKKGFKAEYFKLKVEKGFIAITEYTLADSIIESFDSWLLGPYLFSFMLLNYFLSLTLSVIFASIIQLIVVYCIIRLIYEGFLVIDA